MYGSNHLKTGKQSSFLGLKSSKVHLKFTWKVEEEHEMKTWRSVVQTLSLLRPPPTILHKTQFFSDRRKARQGAKNFLLNVANECLGNSQKVDDRDISPRVRAWCEKRYSAQLNNTVVSTTWSSTRNKFCWVDSDCGVRWHFYNLYWLFWKRRFKITTHWLWEVLLCTTRRQTRGPQGAQMQNVCPTRVVRYRVILQDCFLYFPFSVPPQNVQRKFLPVAECWLPAVGVEQFDSPMCNKIKTGRNQTKKITTKV